jgi:hypothetical protein
LKDGFKGTRDFLSATRDVLSSHLFQSAIAAILVIRHSSFHSYERQSVYSFHCLQLLELLNGVGNNHMLEFESDESEFRQNSRAVVLEREAFFLTCGVAWRIIHVVRI